MNDGHESMPIYNPRQNQKWRPLCETFSGEPSEWLDFRNKYIAKVHNNVFVPTKSKLRNFLACLNSTDKKLIRSKLNAPSSYQSAWRILNKKYEFHKIHNKSPIKFPSSEGEFYSLLKIVNEVYFNLAEVKVYETYFIEIVVEKFDQISLDKWRALPTLNKTNIEGLIEFIENICIKYEIERSFNPK